MASFNANIGKINIGEENVIDPSHSPIIETVEIETITTNFDGNFNIEGESNLLPAGCIVAIDVDGKIKHYKDFVVDEEYRLSVLVNDVDTKKDSVANIIYHGIVKGSKLYYVSFAGIKLGYSEEIKRQLIKNNIYIS